MFKSSKKTIVVDTQQSGRSLWQDAWRRFKKNKMAMISLCFIGLLALMAFSTIIIDIVTNKSILDSKVISQNLINRLQPPSTKHIFGLDEFGRDIFLRIIWGTRYSLFMSTISISVAIIIGSVIGAVSGYYGGVVDNILMRIMDIMLSLPYILLTIAIVAALGPGLVNVLISISSRIYPSLPVLCAARF